MKDATIFGPNTKGLGALLASCKDGQASEHNMADVLAQEIQAAEEKAIDALSRYKFTMFGYWAGIWVHLNRIEGKKRPNPFRELVLAARELKTTTL